MENAAVENALATVGSLLWSLQLLPQAIKSYKRKSTAGLSSHMLLIWMLSASFLGAFLIVKELSIPLIIQPQAFALLASFCWGQCLFYESGYSIFQASLLAASAAIATGALEVSMIFISRSTTSTVPTTVWGICATVVVCVGLLPQYYEIYKYKAVIGISLVFLLVDLFGGVFSTISLAFAPPPFDGLAAASYGAVVILEVGVLILSLILNPAHRRRVALALKESESVLAGTLSETNSEMTQVPGQTPLGWMDEGISEREAATRSMITRPKSIASAVGRERDVDLEE